MDIKKLLEERKALLEELAKPETTEERFNEIRSRVKKIDFIVESAEKFKSPATPSDDELRGARLPNGGTDKTLFDQSKAPDAAKRAAENEQMEKRAADLKAGKAIPFEVRAVTSSSTPLSTEVSGTINPAFEQVGTLDKLVHTSNLHGAESYRQPFVKSYGEGDITSEGGDAATAEPSFGYADINKVKITAYAEVSEEVEKLPAANYLAATEAAVYGAWRKKLIGQIIGGSGKSQLTGIVNAPADVIDSLQTKTIAKIDENTLDEFIFDYGGDENVEDDAVIILNKLTLKEFAKVKGSDKRKAYDIVIKGNRGTINNIPFVCTSKIAAFTKVTDGNPYMLYGKLSGYELTYFAPLEVSKSRDYKFKQGMLALKVSGFVGGAPAMYNGFMKIIKAASPTSAQNGGQSQTPANPGNPS